MREGWVFTTIGEACQLVNGGTPKTKVDQYWGGPHAWIAPAEMGGNESPYFSNTRRTLTDDGLARCSATLLPTNSVIISSRAPIGYLVINKVPMATNQGCKGLVPDNRLDHKYLYYYLYSIVDLLNNLGTGATFKELSATKLKAVPVPLPPLPEQKRIVAILDEAFAGIGRAAANAEKNLANARELFESYLNNIFTQKGEGWMEKTLKQVSINFGRGKSKHRPRNDPKLYGGPYPFIQTGDVRNCEHLIQTSSQSYNETGLAQSKLWPKGTICITIAANIAETGILDFDSCFPDSVIGIVVDETQTTNDFVEYLLQSMKTRIKAKGKGSAQDNINVATFENELFPFPRLNEQKEIVIRLNALLANMTYLEAIYRQKLTALAELKQSLLQKAFAGELTAEGATKRALKNSM